MKLRIKIKMIGSDRIEPEFMKGNAIDCYAQENVVIQPLDPSFYQPVGLEEDAELQATRVDLGFCIEIPRGYCGLLLSRSGLATRHLVSLANGVGLIDDSYRDEVQAALINQGRVPYEVQRGERVCQLLILHSPEWEINWVDKLSPSERKGGFGSTGK